MRDQTKANFSAPLAVLVFFGLLVTYAGLYAALLEPRLRLRTHADGCCRPVRTADYRSGGKFAHYGFLPIHSVDRLVRPGFWSEG